MKLIRLVLGKVILGLDCVFTPSGSSVILLNKQKLMQKPQTIRYTNLKRVHSV